MFALPDADWEQQLEASHADPGTWPAAAPTGGSREAALPSPAPPQRTQRQYREFTGPPAHAVDGNAALFKCQHAPDNAGVSSTLHRSTPQFTLAEYAAQVPPVPSDPAQFLPYYAGPLMAMEVDAGGAWPSLPADPLTEDQLSFYRDYDGPTGGGARGKGWDTTATDAFQTDYKVGDRVEGKDSNGKWHRATVRKVKTGNGVTLYVLDWDFAWGWCRVSNDAWGSEFCYSSVSARAQPEAKRRLQKKSQPSTDVRRLVFKDMAFEVDAPVWETLPPDPLTEDDLVYLRDYDTPTGGGCRGADWGKWAPPLYNAKMRRTFIFAPSPGTGPSST